MSCHNTSNTLSVNERPNAFCYPCPQSKKCQSPSSEEERPQGQHCRVQISVRKTAKEIKAKASKNLAASGWEIKETKYKKREGLKSKTKPSPPLSSSSLSSDAGTLGGRILQMPVFSARGRMRPIKLSGSVNSSQLGSKTGHSGGGTNSDA